MVVFTLEEDTRACTISGRIFIDSRGFVYTHEMMRIHKSLARAIRMIYERAREEDPHITRTKLVHILRVEVAKYCTALTGRTPLVMPIIIEKSIL